MPASPYRVVRIGPSLRRAHRWGHEQDKTQALGAGFDAHLTKPADPAVLERILTGPRQTPESEPNVSVRSSLTASPIGTTETS
jgi:hypothetical protein